MTVLNDYGEVDVDLELLDRIAEVQLAQWAQPHAQGYRTPPWATWGYKGCDDSEYGPFILNDRPTPELQATADRLMDRGLLDGCTCGCRGDFELTDAGWRLQQVLADAQGTPRRPPQLNPGGTDDTT